DLMIGDGELCLVAGPTGSGKSTLLGAINGLVPHFTGGRVTGSVLVAGRNTRDLPPAGMADLVGYVGQDPARGFVAETVEYELAYGMEQAGVPPETMRVRVEETLDLMGIADLRDRKLTDLSGGEQQRVAIGAVLTAHPRVLVLDEPTSALDPGAAEDVMAALTRLVHDSAMTVVVAEHRLERVIQHADRVVVIEPGGVVTSGDPREVMKTSSVAPPIVHLGRAQGWDPLPLTVREARRRPGRIGRPVAVEEREEPNGSEMAVTTRGLSITYGSQVAVRNATVGFRRGEIAVVMGRNGSGKSSLFWALQGSLEPDRGTVERNVRVGLVPQSPADLLFLPTVAAECEQADTDANVAAGSCRELLDELADGIDGLSHPRDLSEGQRLALVLALQLVTAPDALLLDEPTRGLDYNSKEQLAGVLRRMAGQGKCVVLSTHDVEFAALVADRVVVMSQGEVVSDGRARAALTASPLFAPQIAKVMAPEPVLRVDEVVAVSR
ncbi:MAG: ATP-binding cassette domain-containing protein, partial [Acidimicrobiia bacterium]|nr:ATP-binding cassette domain-containing protein [Acidimicrobiia bacterium]